MTAVNPFVSLLPKINPKPDMIPSDGFKDITSMDKEALTLFQKAGVTAQMLQKTIEGDIKVAYDRFNIYSEVERACEHWFIGPALDLYANVSTVFSSIRNCTCWVTSKSETYRKELSDLFDRIGLEEKIYDWAYSIGLYGDLMAKVNGAPGLGIISLEDGIHPMNVSRLEYDGVLIGFYDTPQGLTQRSAFGIGNDSEKQQLIPPWEYVHFRLLGAKRRRPRASNDSSQAEMKSVNLITGSDTRQVTTKYGTSLLINAIPAYKRLRLAEDSILLSRLTRGIVKYIWKCKVDMCLRGSTKISLMNGTTPTIQEMAEDIDNYLGKSVWTVNEKTNNLEVGKIKNVKKTRKNAQLVRVTLDNGEHIDCTPDHPFMLRDGTYKEAQHLTVNESLMPFYQKKSNKVLDGYNLVYNPGDNLYHYEHRLSVGSLNKGNVVHHKNGDKNNNDISNLQIFESQKEHIKCHYEQAEKYGFAITAKLPKTKEHVQKVVASRRANGQPWLSEETRKHIGDAQRGETELRICPVCNSEFKCLKTSDQKFCNLECAYNIQNGRKTRRMIHAFVSKFCNCGCQEMFKQRLYPKDYQANYIQGHSNRGQNNPNSKINRDKREAKVLNHKVSRIEWLEVQEDTYDIEIDGNHNFPLASGIFVHNSNMEAASSMIDQYATLITQARAVDTGNNPKFDSKNNSLTAIEDIFVPVWGDVGDLTVEKIGESPDIRWIVDVDNLRNQLAFALACSPSLGGAFTKESSGALGSEAISELGIRFARSARRLQRALISGIIRICQIHLAYMGYDPDPDLFEVHMSETSTAEEGQLMKSLQTGINSFNSFMKTMKVVAGNKVDALKVWEYFNEKIIRLEDFDIMDFMKSPEVLAKEAELRAKAELMKQGAGGVPPEKKLEPGIPTDKIGKESIEISGLEDEILFEQIQEAIERKKLKEETNRKQPVFNLDIISYLPLVHSSSKLNESKSEDYPRSSALVILKDSKNPDPNKDWLFSRDAAIWESKFGTAYVSEGIEETTEQDEKDEK